MGPYKRGSVVRIPAIFKNNSGDYVDIEAANVSIEHMDNEQNKLIYDLQDRPMDRFGIGQYVYEYRIPTYSNPGNYVVKISYKPINGKSFKQSAQDYFKVTEEIAHSINTPYQENGQFPTIQESFGHINCDIEDIVLTREGQPIPDVYIDIFEKKDFKPKDPNNVKIASTQTNHRGQWNIRIPRGEYIFVYRAVGMREVREIRKVQPR